MNTYVHLRQYVTEFFLEWEMFQTNVVKKIKMHNLTFNFFPKIVVYEMMWKDVLQPDRPQITI
jgi:hypothetical protein